MRLRCLAAGLMLASPFAVRAQRPATGAITGVLHDSLYNRPLAGATVFAARAPGDSAMLRLATSDEKGRYRVDSLPAGMWMVTFSTDLLDSLQFTPPERRVTVTGGAEAHADLSTPSAATLRTLVCPGVPMKQGEGALFGQVTDAEGAKERPLSGATVVVGWSDFVIDRATLQVTTSMRSAGAVSDSLGRYRLCGVPTDVPLMVQVQHDGGAGSPIQLSVRDSVGVAMQPIVFSTASARVIASLDSAVARHDSVLPALTGNSSVSGVVRTSTGQPVGEAQVNVAGAASVVRTDSAGRYALHGLPAGSQQLEVRRVGYSRARVAVALRDGVTATQDVSLQHFVSLDSIRVIAKRVRYTEFEARAKRGGFGRFLREEDIARRAPWNTSDLLRMMPGFHVLGNGFDAKVVSSRALVGGLGSFGGGPCELNIVIDRMQHQDINLVSPKEIAAMEVYGGPAGAPPEFDSRCGLIVIWTK